MQFDTPWAETLPPGLSRLHGLARALTELPVRPGQQVRVWASVPTTNLAVATATLGALSVAALCDGCRHDDLADGAPVSAYVNGRFEDTTVHLDVGTVRYSGVKLAADRAVLRRLPDRFPERRPARLDAALREHVACAHGCDPTLAGWRLAEVSGHPVVIVGEPRAAVADMDALAGHTGAATLPAWAASACIDDWYRRPVLMTGPMPDLRERAWLRDVRPRLILITTAAAAASNVPWPDVPVLSLLSRRSPSAVPAADRVHEQFDGPPAAGLSARLASALRPGNGLEIHSAVVSTALATSVAAEVDDEVIW